MPKRCDLKFLDPNAKFVRGPLQQCDIYYTSASLSGRGAFWPHPATGAGYNPL